MHSSSALADTSSAGARVAGLLLTAVVLYFCLFDGLDAIGLTGPDEPRYAAIAREMSETGDWVTPRLHGKPWFEKPILYYWAAAVQYKLWGDGEIAARLPSAIAAALTAAALGWLGWRLYGWAAAQIVVLLFPATVAAIGFGRAATTDMQFSAALALAMAAAVFIVRPQRAPMDWEETAYAGVKTPPRQRALARWLWRCGFGAALGLAALAKGPAAVVLAGGSVGLWVLATRRWKDAFALAHPLAIASFLVVALPWYVLCALRNPEFVDVFLISHNVQRFLTPVFQHEQPFWFFGPILLLAVLPWTPLLVAVARDGLLLVRERRWTTSSSFFLGCWVIFPVLFFSASTSKLPGYMLPVIPPLTLLLARSVSKGIGQRDALARWLLVSTGALLMLLGGAAASPDLVEARMPNILPHELRPLAITLMACGTLVSIVAMRRKNALAIALAAMTIAAAAGMLTRSVLPQMDASVSPRKAAHFLVAATRGQPEAVSVYRLHRAWHYGLNYYLRREIPAWTEPNRPEFVVLPAGAWDDLKVIEGLRIVRRVSPQAIIAGWNDLPPSLR